MIVFSVTALTSVWARCTGIEWLYDKIPSVLKILFSKADLEKLVDSVVEEVKKKWAENKDIQSYIESRQLMRLTTLEIPGNIETLNMGDILEGVNFSVSSKLKGV